MDVELYDTNYGIIGFHNFPCYCGWVVCKSKNLLSESILNERNQYRIT